MNPNNPNYYIFASPEKTLEIMNIKWTAEQKSVWQPNENIQFSIIQKDNKWLASLNFCKPDVPITSQIFDKPNDAQNWCLEKWQQITKVNDVKIFLTEEELSQIIKNEKNLDEFGPDIQEFITEFRKNFGQF